MQNIILQNKRIAITASFLVCLMSILILFAWQFDLVFIKDLFPGKLLSNPVTALCFLLGGFSFFCLIRNTGRFMLIGNILAAIILTISLIKVGEIVFNYSSFIDKWLFTEKLEYFGIHGKPNFMAPNTSFCFLLVSISLILSNYRIKSKNLWCDYFAIAAVFLAFLSITGYLYNSLELYSVSSSIPMAFPTAVSFLFLAAAILFYRSGFGLFSVFTRKYYGSKLARSLIPFAIIIPVVTGALRLYGHKTGWFSVGFGTAIYSNINIVVFVFLIWRSSVSLNKSQKSLFLEMEERKLAQDETKSNQLFLDTVLEHIPDLAFIKNPMDFTFVRVNKAFEDLLGFSRDELIGKAIHDLIPGETGAFMLKADKDILQSKERMVYQELSIPTKFGLKWFTVKKVVITHPSNGNVFILGIGQDVTEQKLLNDKIKEFNRELEDKVATRTRELYKNEKLFRSMIENSVDIITIVSRENTVTYVSPAIERVLGIHPEEVMGKNNPSFIHPDSQKDASSLRNEIINHPGVPKFTRLKVIHKDGQAIWMEGTMINLLHDENVKGIVSNFHDVTERIEAEENSRQLEHSIMQDKLLVQKQLIQASVEGQEKEKKQIGMELHDNINQILASSKMYLEIGKSDSSFTAVMIQKSVDQINIAIQEIRKLSRALVPHGIEEGGIVDGIKDITNALSMSSEIKFNIQISNDAIRKLDGRQQTAIYRIVQEQLNNISKHSKAKNVSILLALNQDIFDLEISDDGVGFAMDKKRNGIGLSNIKTRSELLNGELSVISEQGKGCILRVEFAIDHKATA